MHNPSSCRNGKCLQVLSPPCLLMASAVLARRREGKKGSTLPSLLRKAESGRHLSMAPKNALKPGKPANRKRKAVQLDVEQGAEQEALQDSVAIQQAEKEAAEHQQPGPERDDGDCMPDAPLKHNSKKLVKLQDQYNRRGVVYISRIPPHMVRHGAAVSAHLLLVDTQLWLHVCAEAPEIAASLRTVWRA